MNSPLLNGLAVWLRILLPGLAWLWILPEELLGRNRPPGRFLSAGAGAALLGVGAASLSILILGELGLFTPLGDRVAWWALTAGGILAGLMIDRQRPVRLILQALPVSGVLLAGFVAIMALPERGEWIVGGWDPGVYAGQAAALERTGTFYPPDNFFYDTLTETEREIFTRTGHGRTERFPAVIIHPESRGFTFEFFRLTPAFFAGLQRSGGTAALTRGNTFLALLLLPLFLALIHRWSGPAHAVFAGLILITQPIWLFHTHWPLTEMLQLFLVCGILWFGIHLTDDNPGHTPAMTILTALLLAAAVLNRFSFLPFAGVLMVCLALGAAPRPDRRAVIASRAALIAGCLAAGLANVVIAPVSLRGWSVISQIINFTASTMLLALVLDLFFSLAAVRRWRERLSERQIDLAGLLLLAGLIGTWLFRSGIGGPRDIDNLARLAPFIGRLPLCLSAAGLVALLFLRPRLRAAVFFPLCLFLLAGGWMMVLRKNITDWYPWATRRYLPNLVPFVALSGGYLLARLWTLRNFRPWGKVTAVLLLGVTLLSIYPAAYRAGRYTSYNGAGDILEKIDAQIEPDDIVISDHPLWGTPLALFSSRQVLNGREIWSDRTGERAAGLDRALIRLAGEGRRVRFLTTTGAGIEIYPLDPGRFTLDWTSPEFSWQEIIQHTRADRFHLRTVKAGFRLYTFRGP